MAQWDEEWDLLLIDPDGTGVEILCVTEAFSPEGAVAEDVSRAVGTKHKKFADKRWAELHVLVMDTRVPLDVSDYAALAISCVPTDQLSDLDLVALARGDSVVALWWKPQV